MTDTPTPRDVFVGWHCTGVMGHRKPQCSEPCAWCCDQASNDMTNITAAGYVVVPREPTEAMHDAARNWSLAKYGQGIGFDASLGCYRAMIAAATKESEG